MAQILFQKICSWPKNPAQLSPKHRRNDRLPLRPSYLAARHIGGDYYDFVQISDSALGITVGDVSGKGVSAALYMAKLSSEMRFHARGCLSPGAVLTELNRSLAEEMESGMFVTLALMVLEPEKRRLTISSAGHPPPLRRSSNGTVAELRIQRNLPLGAYEDTQYGETEHMVQAGDSVILYTDGVTEAVNKDGVLFGAEQLKRVIASSGEGGPRRFSRRSAARLWSTPPAFPKATTWPWCAYRWIMRPAIAGY
jgi:sigma-B regulation protein RsbU (phosphoserine phosphatase)